MNEKYIRVKNSLDESGYASIKVFGNSMTPIIKSGTRLTFKKCDEYEIGDIVFCKVKGRYIQMLIKLPKQIMVDI